MKVKTVFQNFEPQRDRSVYFPRRLSFSDGQEVRQVEEGEFLNINGSKIVLGDPGMGKTALVQELSRRLGVTPITAARFMLSRNPASFIESGKPLLIDALDEAMSRHEGDAIDTVIAQLEAAGSPDFILSCRAREWQARTESGLRQLYGVDPHVFTLESFSRTEASAFLTWRYPTSDAEEILNHLDGHDLADLYRNPFTLGLMGKVAESDQHLPESRAALFERVCTLIWPEHDPDRQDTGLAQATEDQALNAAGAICAGLLFAGDDTISAAGAAQSQDGDVRLSELTSLPDAEAARAVFSSKLFTSIGPLRAKPVHRVIAEFLAARWLATQARTPRAQRRLLAQLQGSGAVPASLRGLHAWLAFHSPTMSRRVLSADPYGVLRYGETSNLSAAQADCLFEALCVLAKDDPFFRSADWNSRTAAGLMIAPLRGKIGSLIGSAKSNGHLRSLLIEGVKGTTLAADLADTLEGVIFSRERFYRERKDAVEGLWPLRTIDWWQSAVDCLRSQGDEDSTRLAWSLVEKIGVDIVSLPLLVATLFAGMGVTISSWPRVKIRRTRTLRHYGHFLSELSLIRLRDAIDQIVDYSSLIRKSDWQNWRDVAEVISHLIVRAIKGGIVSDSDAGAVWRWLTPIENAHRFNGEIKDHLTKCLASNDALRRAIQHHALLGTGRKETLWLAALDLHRRVGLLQDPEDIRLLLERFADGDNQNSAIREDWCDLMHFARGPNGFDPTIAAAADRFIRGDKQLLLFMHRLEKPPKLAWEKKREQQAEKRKRKEKAAIATQRRAYTEHRSDVRAGELGYVLGPSHAYLGLFDDTPKNLPPSERIIQWLGDDLLNDALMGFEAVLQRDDLPTASEIAQGIARGTTYNYSFPLMAGLLERQRSGRGLTDLPYEIRMIGLLLCHDATYMGENQGLPALRDELEAMIVPRDEDREAFARLWIEPSIVEKQQHIAGLYMLARDPKWQKAGAVLAAEWLAEHVDLPEGIELELVDCLTYAGALKPLREIAVARSKTIFRNFEHMLAWIAIDTLVRFEDVRTHIEGIGNDHPEFIWFLRNRFQPERRGVSPTLTAAQSAWIISEFRTKWPYAVLMGSGSGNTNDYDATDFLRLLIGQLADDTSAEAERTLQSLINAPTDTYSELIQHMAAEQRQKRAEEEFTPLRPAALLKLLSDGPPANPDDLKALVLEELAVAQKKLIGEDIDQIRDFWTDSGVPRNENRCRDRLAAIIGPELSRYNIQRITEADMPLNKRADLAFSYSQLQLPMEIKGQWHSDVWDAASNQLDALYLADWRSEQRGIYCVLWFGDQPATNRRRLRAHPDNLLPPITAMQMKAMLIDRIPDTRRSLIDVVVIDLGLQSTGATA